MLVVCPKGEYCREDCVHKKPHEFSESCNEEYCVPNERIGLIRCGKCIPLEGE